MKIKRAMSHSLWIAHKDLLEFSRNRVMVVMLAVFPLFLMVMTGYIFPTDNMIEDMPVVIVNQDNIDGVPGMEGTMLVNALETLNEDTGFFKFKEASSEGKARDLIRKGESTGAIIVSSNFTQSLRSKEQGVITVLFDQSKPQVSLQLTQVIDTILDQLGTNHAIQEVNKTTGLDIGASTTIVKPYSVRNKGTVEGSPNYFSFLAPGIMMMVIMFGVMNGLPRAIAHEKEAGTLDGIMAAPTSRFAIIMGKTIAQTVRGFIQGLVVLIMALFIFGATVNGSMILVLLLMFLGVFSFIGLGIMITSLAKTEETASTFIMVLQFPMMFLSGVFFPIEQMPWYMQYIARALPLTYATQALRKVMVLGAGIQDIIPEVSVLILFGAVMLVISVWLFKKAMTK